MHLEDPGITIDIISCLPVMHTDTETIVEFCTRIMTTGASYIPSVSFSSNGDTIITSDFNDGLHAMLTSIAGGEEGAEWG